MRARGTPATIAMLIITAAIGAGIFWSSTAEAVGSNKPSELTATGTQDGVRLDCVAPSSRADEVDGYRIL